MGRGLAEALNQLGNTVIISGRRRAALEEVTAANPGMHSRVLDIADEAQVEQFGNAASVEFPKLNVLINNAGIQVPERLKGASRISKPWKLRFLQIFSGRYASPRLFAAA